MGGFPILPMFVVGGSGNPLWSGRLSTDDLLIKIGRFVKEKNIDFQYKKQPI
jgi:hypothetical protein